MAKVYGPPEEVQVPRFNPDTWQRDDRWFTQKLKNYCQQYGSGAEKGEVISFPVADGAALYMVFSSKPLTLIHMPLGDAWQFAYAHRLTIRDVRECIRRQRSLDALFGEEVNNGAVVQSEAL